MKPLPPVRRQVVVPSGPELAFAVFTEEIGAWWPLGEHSIHGADAGVAFRDGKILEEGPAGEVALWGTVLDAAPPDRISFTWHPGMPAEQASEVSISFVAVGDQTLVTLEHSGWEAFADDPAKHRANYNHGWPIVLGRFEKAATGGAADKAGGGEPVWLTLLHTPGAALADGESIFAHPGFPEHLAFLRRLAERGVLIGAGPLPDAPGNGMAVLRITDPADVAEYVRLTQDDDQSVVSEVLSVRVRPWRVRVTGLS
jgi:uncharacterized protein YciI/uncharacterized protein YndB with AHSA1/START domain